MKMTSTNVLVFIIMVMVMVVGYAMAHQDNDQANQANQPKHMGLEMPKSYPRSNSKSKCNFIIPGLTNIAFGWDGAKIDISGFFTSDYSGYGMYPVIDITCNLNQTWVNPFNRDYVYDIPDQISDQVRMSGGSYTDATISSFRTLNELYISMYANIETDGIFGMFESSSVSVLISMGLLINK